MKYIYNFSVLFVDDLTAKGYVVDYVDCHYAKISKVGRPEFIMAMCDTDGDGRRRVVDFVHYYGLDAAFVLKSICDDYEDILLADEDYVFEDMIEKGTYGKDRGDFSYSVFEKTKEDIYFAAEHLDHIDRTKNEGGPNILFNKAYLIKKLEEAAQN